MFSLILNIFSKVVKMTKAKKALRDLRRAAVDREQTTRVQPLPSRKHHAEGSLTLKPCRPESRWCLTEGLET